MLIPYSKILSVVVFEGVKIFFNEIMVVVEIDTF